MSLVTNLGFFLLAVAVLVSFHEFGHFIVARWMGVRVLKFSVGFGRTVWRWQSDPDKTEYAIGLVPLGGYVQMLDEREREVEPSQRHLAFNRKSLVRRSAIVLAGPAANLLLAVCLYWVTGLIGGNDLAPIVKTVVPGSPAAAAGFRESDRIVLIDGRAVQGWSQHRLYLLNQVSRERALHFDVERGQNQLIRLTIPAVAFKDAPFDPSVLSRTVGLIPRLPVLLAIVGAVLEGSPAERSGLQVNDLVQKIDGKEIEDWGDLVKVVGSNPERELSFSVLRAGETLTVRITPESTRIEDKLIGRVGIQSRPGEGLADHLVQVRYGPVAGVTHAVETTWLMSSLTVRLLADMLVGKASTESISGPVSIARYAGQSAKLGPVQFLLFLAVLSVSLGVLNLLPIPVLDGGHLVYFLVEAIQGKPVSQRVMQWGQQLGIGIIILLMALAFYNDILSLLR
jgi:regulator of sigma E protease